MARRTFRLLKDSMEIKKGALVQEKCDDGDQEYVVLNVENHAQKDDLYTYFSNPSIGLSRKTVEEQPSWFEEVFHPGNGWFTKEEMKAFDLFLKKSKSTSKRKK